MTKQTVILAIDEGTTNSKAVLVNRQGSIITSGTCAVETHHPQPGWVQQDANQIWSSTKTAIKECLKGIPDVQIEAIGISNQRESVLAWHRLTGEPLGPVITWQCRRTAAACEALKEAGHEQEVISRTGLPLDPLFPATKIGYLLNHLTQAVSDEHICVGTVDSWLIWNFTGGQHHATDSSNAARTQLFNIGTMSWDHQLTELFNLDLSMLPTVQDSASLFGRTSGVDGLEDGIPIASAIGDSHGALFSHGAYSAGDTKITFGTGSSVMSTLQDYAVPPKGLTTTIAWSLDNTPVYAFEGNILVSASILPWTAELLGLPDVDALFELGFSVEDSLGVTLVPALVGLGSPHWNSEAQGLISGLSFATSSAHIARASIDSVALQVNDVLEIMQAHSPKLGNLYVDGGPSKNRKLMQLVADYLDQTITTRDATEASALGAAFLAGLQVGYWPDIETIAKLADVGKTLSPGPDNNSRINIKKNWQISIARSILTAP